MDPLKPIIVNQQEVDEKWEASKAQVEMERDHLIVRVAGTPEEQKQQADYISLMNRVITQEVPQEIKTLSFAIRQHTENLSQSNNVPTTEEVEAKFNSMLVRIPTARNAPPQEQAELFKDMAFIEAYGKPPQINMMRCHEMQKQLKAVIVSSCIPQPQT